MNARFEPDGLKIGSWFDELYIKWAGPYVYYPIGDFQQVIKFVGDKIKESNFSTHLSDAHLSINAGYKFIDTNDEKLKMKFPKNKNNILFDDNFDNQNNNYSNLQNQNNK